MNMTTKLELSTILTLPRNGISFANWAEPSIKQVSKAANRKDQKYHRSLFLFPFLRARASRGSRLTTHRVRSIALKTLGKERDCSQSNLLLWFVTSVHLPFSFQSLDISLLHLCLWRALYVVLLGEILRRVELLDCAIWFKCSCLCERLLIVLLAVYSIVS